jgi:coiled-coil domain-containing protein 61
MLISALLKTSDSSGAEILSYREMNNKFGKPGAQSKAITPEQASKRFLLLTYVGEFEKMQFPLPLMQFPNVTPGRLKLTIRRLAQ